LASLFLLDQFPDNFLNIVSKIGDIFVLYLAWSTWSDLHAGQ